MSPDLSTVFVCEEQPLPDNSEVYKSTEYPRVRGLQLRKVLLGGGGGKQTLGVACEPVYSKDWPNSYVSRSPAVDSDRDPGGGFWTVSLYSGEFWASPQLQWPTQIETKPNRVRIQLDWERGCLIFSHPNDITLM